MALVADPNKGDGCAVLALHAIDCVSSPFFRPSVVDDFLLPTYSVLGSVLQPDSMLDLWSENWFVARRTGIRNCQRFEIASKIGSAD